MHKTFRTQRKFEIKKKNSSFQYSWMVISCCLLEEVFKCGYWQLPTDGIWNCNQSLINFQSRDISRSSSARFPNFTVMSCILTRFKLDSPNVSIPWNRESASINYFNCDKFPLPPQQSSYLWQFWQLHLLYIFNVPFSSCVVTTKSLSSSSVANLSDMASFNNLFK